MPTSSAERFQRGHEAQGGHAPFEASLRVLRSMKTDQGFLQETANAGLSLRGEMSRRSVLRFTGYRLQTVNYHMFGLFGSKFSSASVEKVANDMTPAAVVHLRCPLCVFLQTSFRVCRHNFLDVVSFNHFPLRVGELVFKSACDLRVSLPPARLIPATWRHSQVHAHRFSRVRGLSVSRPLAQLIPATRRHAQVHAHQFSRVRGLWVSRPLVQLIPSTWRHSQVHVHRHSEFRTRPWPQQGVEGEGLVPKGAVPRTG